MGNVWRNQVNEADLDLWTFLIPILLDLVIGKILLLLLLLTFTFFTFFGHFRKSLCLWKS